LPGSQKKHIVHAHKSSSFISFDKSREYYGLFIFKK
jgi:hypothetical protein